MASETRPARRRGRPVESDDSVSRDRVIETATGLFLQFGYAGTSLKMIAQELGISAPALYWYFPSKEEIYAVVIETAMRDFVGYVKSSVTASEPAAHLGQMVRAHVTWQLNQADVARAFAVTMGTRVLAHSLPDERALEIRQLERDYLEDLRAILRAGNDSGVFRVADIKTTAFAIITMCEYVHTWFNPRGSMSVEAVANRYEELALAMAGAEHTPGPAQARPRARTKKPAARA